MLYTLFQVNRCFTFIENINSCNDKKKRFGYKAGQHIQSVILCVDSTIAEGVQWSKDYAISDPLPLQWGRISVKHKEAAVPAFAAISPGTTYRTVAAESISVISSLSKSRGEVFYRCAISFVGSDPA